ncbi:MAG: valine--tRNA ligase [archaeon]
MAEIKDKRWSKELEQEIYEKWKKDKTYEFNENTKKPIYSIDTPPPYVNSPVHIGQATTYALMDMFARFKRMTGFEVLFPLGLDRNGLPIEMAAEKKFKIKLTETPRKEFIKYCYKVLEESSAASTESFLRLGLSFNSWKLGDKAGDVYHTDSESYRTLTQETFIDMWKKGLIYEDERVNNWCPGCQTTVADSEIEYKDIETYFNDIKFKVKESGEEIIIGTTRPELVCTCGIVIFNPEDERYKELEGKTAISPIFGKEIPIKAHPMADIDKGTGLAMMCSAGDLTDIRFFREQKLEPVIAINQDGTMNKHAGFLKGLKVREARKKMIETLLEKDLLVNKKKTIHRTPICERSKDEIEFISMSEFYVKQTHYKSKMKQMAKKLNFYSPQSRQILLDWIESVSIDWPISRRRYYATEIPLWYCECGEVILPPKGKYYQPWKEDPPIKKCPKCGGTKFKGEERVFDTWFDSSITPLYILKYSRDKKFFEKAKPCTLRPQGKEIIRTWLYYTLLKCHMLTDESIFSDVWINYHIVDEKGHKMSKSVGNIINPKEILDKLGAEPFRLWAVVEGNLEKTDFRCSFERIEGAGKTLVKLWNVARFISRFPTPKGEHKLTDLDKWIINEMNELTEFAKQHYEIYDFHNPSTKIKNFIWEAFSSHYLELVKTRAYNPEGKYSDEEQNGALYTLNYCLETILKLWAPVLPMMTYKLYQDLRGEDIHACEFPTCHKKFDNLPFTTENVFELNSYVWKSKKDNSLALNAEVKTLTIPENLKSVKKDVQLTHKVQEIGTGKKLKLEFL